MITRAEAAAALNGNQYREEGSRDLFRALDDAGLVAVFGASDDLMEMRGAVDDEVGAYDGGTAYFSPSGLVQNECREDDCPYHANEIKRALRVDALWCAEDGFSWTYQTTIPHDTFVIMEDDEPYCRGIVFSLSDTGTT